MLEDEFFEYVSSTKYCLVKNTEQWKWISDFNSHIRPLKFQENTYDGTFKQHS